MSSAWAVVAAAMTTASAASMAASMVGGSRGAHLGRDIGGTRRVGIGDDDAVDAGRGRQQPAVEPPDPARPEQCDLHRPSSFRCRGATAAEPSQRGGQDPPPDRRALRRRPPRAVLLDHQPAVVVAAGRGGEDAVEVEQRPPRAR